METIFITGGAGAIGSNLAEHLVRRGHRVIVMDDLSSGSVALLPREVVFHRGSVERMEDLDVISSYDVDLIFHLAALFANQNSVDHPDRDIAVNGLGTINVLTFARQRKVRKVLFTSSSCVYGDRPNLAEDDPTIVFSDETPYAITKFIGEKYCRFWNRFHGLNTVIVRLFNSYGPGDYPGRFRSVIPNFMASAMMGRSLNITGTGMESRDFNYVDDTVQGLLRVMFGDTAPAETFNVGSGRGTSILDLANMVNAICANTAPLVFLPRRDWDGVTHRVAQIDKIVNRLGYSPTIPIATGLNQTHLWFKTHVQPQ
ncbi:MAG: NAD-dependent epimerase/dehydratase family protein [Magnetococcales bacterium]|nr:NAD-dependent epimerase/dehydratase family protein [Magnetococcales bacterium]